MPSQDFIDQLNAQIGNEYAAHNQYVACAVYYDLRTMPRMASLFYNQAIEERDHAMMMVQYLIDQDAKVEVPGIAAPINEFSDVIAPVQLALDQERRVTDQINALTALARRDNDFASEQFMYWFIKEQVEEVARMSDLLNVVTRSSDDVEAIEDYVIREASAQGTDASAPRIAGA